MILITHFSCRVSVDLHVVFSSPLPPEDEVVYLTNVFADPGMIF